MENPEKMLNDDIRGQLKPGFSELITRITLEKRLKPLILLTFSLILLDHHLVMCYT